MSTSDVDSGVVNGLGHSSLEDNGLKSSFEELSGSKSKNVIEFVLTFLEETELDHSLDKSLSFEDSLGIGGVEGKELSGSLSDSTETMLDLEHFSLGLETVGTDDFKLLIESLLLEGPGRLSEVSSIYNARRSVIREEAVCLQFV